MQRNMFQQKKEDRRVKTANAQQNQAAFSFTTSDPNALRNQFGMDPFQSGFGSGAQSNRFQNTRQGNDASFPLMTRHGDAFNETFSGSNSGPHNRLGNFQQFPIQDSKMWQQSSDIFPSDKVVVHRGSQGTRVVTSKKSIQESSDSFGDIDGMSEMLMSSDPSVRWEASTTVKQISTVRHKKTRRVFINGKEVEQSEEVEQDDNAVTMHGTTQGTGQDMGRMMVMGGNDIQNFGQGPVFNSGFDRHLTAEPNRSFGNDRLQVVQKQSSSPFQGFCNSAFGFGANVNDLIQGDGGRHGWFSGMQLAIPTQSALAPSSRTSGSGTKSHFTFHAVNRKMRMTNVNGNYSVQAAQQEQVFEYYSEDDDDDDDDDKAIDYSRILPDEGLRRSIMPLALTSLPLPVTGSRRLALPAPPASTSTKNLAILPSRGYPEATDKSLQISQLSIQGKTPSIDVRSTRYYFVAKEIADKEKTYRDVLFLLDQIFRKKVIEENKTHRMFSDKTIKDMFSNVDALFTFHDKHLLPKLKERLDSWESKPKIGDVLKNAAPYLKIYEYYINNYNKAMQTLYLHVKKKEMFGRIVEELQCLQECQNIPLFDHMIAPIQRMPRYRLLLEEYLKRLPTDSEDRSDAEEALNAISIMSRQANESLRAVEQFQEVLEAQEAMGGTLDLVSPSRFLRKHGDIKKISMKSLLHFDRHLYLFSDILVVCAPRLFARSYKWKVKAIFSLDQMYVMEGDDLEVPNTFFVIDSGRKFEFHTKTAEDKQSWMEAIFVGIRDTMTARSSEPSRIRHNPLIFSSEGVSKCMECNANFSVIKKRCHCRSCGSVICYYCGDSKRVLPWTAGKAVRVCKYCKEQLASAPPPATDSKLLGLLAVPARNPGIIDGWVCLYNEESHNIIQRWFVLRDDQVLYTYEKETDKVAVTAAPIRGFVVDEVTETIKKKGVRKMIRLKGNNRMYFLMPKSLDDHSRWLRCLQEVSQLTPSPT